MASLTTTELRLWLQEIARSRSRRLIRPSTEPLTEEESRRRKTTANRVWAAFRAALNMAFNEGRVESDLAWRRVKPFRNVDRPRVRFLELEEIRALIAACDPAKSVAAPSPKLYYALGYAYAGLGLKREANMEFTQADEILRDSRALRSDIATSGTTAKRLPSLAPTPPP